MSLRQLIWACVGTITLVFVISMSILLAGRFAVTHSVQQLSTRMLPALNDVSALSKAYVDQETGQRGFLLTANPALLDPYTEGKADADRLVAELRTDLAGDPEASQELGAVVAAAADWTSQAAEPQIAARRAGPIPPDQLQSMTQSGKRLFDELRTQLSALQSRTNNLIDSQIDRVNSAQLIAHVAQAIASALLLGIVVATVWLSRRLLTRPVNIVLNDVTAVANGAYDRPIRSVGPREVSVLAGAAETMRNNLHVANERLADQSARDEKARRAKEIQAQLLTEVQAAPDLASAGSIIVSRTAQALDAKHGALYLRQ
ncbi:HAMP domain-containing protein, partial [Mycolicibacterium sp. P1-5]